jgi:hypothetical protein
MPFVAPHPRWSSIKVILVFISYVIIWEINLILLIISMQLYLLV